MIIAFTPNPAVDITYAVGSVTLGASHRVTDVRERAGGKGVNTASVLAAMGWDCVAVAPVGGPGRPAYEADLSRRGVPAELVDSPVDLRRSIAVMEPDGRATVFNEAGGEQPGAVWQRVSDRLRSLSRWAAVLTISGSLPTGAPADLVRRLAVEGRQRGLQVILDVGGETLARAVAESPALVKPNLSEANAALSDVGAGPFSATDAARMLTERGARSAVVSDGAKGLTLWTATGPAMRAWLPSPLPGNPTGAGDALTASLAADLDAAHGLPVGRDAWARVLRRAVAWSAAAVLQPVAGEVDPGDVDRLLSSVETEEITS